MKNCTHPAGQAVPETKQPTSESKQVVRSRLLKMIVDNERKRHGDASRPAVKS